MQKFTDAIAFILGSCATCSPIYVSLKTFGGDCNPFKICWMWKVIKMWSRTHKIRNMRLIGLPKTWNPILVHCYVFSPRIFSWLFYICIEKMTWTTILHKFVCNNLKWFETSTSIEKEHPWFEKKNTQKNKIHFTLQNVGNNQLMGILVGPWYLLHEWKMNG